MGSNPHPMGNDVVMQSLLTSALRQHAEYWQDALRVCRRRLSCKAVHSFRVTTRRFIAVIELIREVRPCKSADKIRRRLKRVLKDFDELRDTQMLHDGFVRRWRELEGVRPFRKHLRQREAVALGRLQRDLRNLRTRKLKDRLRRLKNELIETDPSGIGAAAREALGKAFRELQACASQRRRLTPSGIHRIRIAFKRFRYRAEVLAPLLPFYSSARLVALHDFQTCLGNVQDAAVLRRAHERFARTHPNIASNAILASAFRRHQRAAVNAFLRRRIQISDFEPPLQRCHSGPVARGGL